MSHKIDNKPSTDSNPHQPTPEAKMFQPNIGNSIFPGFNDKQGIMLCGYEWGLSKADQDFLQTNEHKRAGVIHAFSNKSLEYGKVANTWRYDQRIIHWFEIFGHKLNTDGTGGDFEKCLLQTNWCNTEGNKIEENYWTKLLNPEQVNNFIGYIEEFKPKLIFFFGSQIIKILQHDSVLPRFMNTAGSVTGPLTFHQKQFTGRTFDVTFQSFENCKIVAFPHPSSSRGLSDNYIRLFSREIDNLLQEFKKFKGIS